MSRRIELIVAEGAHWALDVQLPARMTEEEDRTELTVLVDVLDHEAVAKLNKLERKEKGAAIAHAHSLIAPGRGDILPV